MKVDRERQRAGSGGDRRAPASSDADRRNANRTSATCGVSEEDGTRIHLCQAEDIAIGGITIKHADGLSHELRTEVALRIALPGSPEQLEARGEIVSAAKADKNRLTGD